MNLRFGPACAVDGQVAVESGLERDTDHFSVQFPQYDTGVLSDIGNEVKDLSCFLLGHKARCPVGTFVGVHEVAVPVIFTCVAVPHPHDHKDQNGYRDDTDSDPIKTIRKAKRRDNAGQETRVRELRGGPAVKRAASSGPDVIVVEELPDVATAIEQSGEGEGQDDEQLNQVLSQGETRSFRMRQNQCTEY